VINGAQIVTPDDQVGTDAGGSRTAFPALEVYSYQPGKDPVQIFPGWIMRKRDVKRCEDRLAG
jgi:hypothetical protein